MRLITTLCLLLVLHLPTQLQATHLMGGEITWTCESNGWYVFTMKLYRDCNGVPVQLPVALRVHNHPTVTGFGLQLVSQTDISPVCDGAGVSISCAGGGAGAVEEFVFRSNPVNLPGTPPPQGWIFTYDSCCRNEAVNLQINTIETGFTLRAIMYPYNGENASPCFDNSPVFTALPATVICVGSPFTYNHNAFDEDKDSLRYAFDQPLDWLDGTAFTETNPPGIPWITAGNFSVDSPFPSLGASIPATLNPETGEISFTSQLTGNFVTVVRVDAYRCGQLIASIFRDIQVVIINCPNNNPPLITAPFQDPGSGQASFNTTVQAGDLVNFTITTNDNDVSLINGQVQSISVTASGGLFGDNFTDISSGCPYPPCATLTPPPPVVLQNGQSITFNWQTDCSHVSLFTDCYTPASSYTFVLVFQDNGCPAPSYRIATIAVEVVAPPLLESPEVHCVDVQDNGDILLSWTPVSDPDGYFNSYHVFSATSPAGPFTAIDSIFNINTGSYLHAGAGGNDQSVYYYVSTRSGCGGAIFSPATDTLQSIYLSVSDAGSGAIDLNWNALAQQLPAGTNLPYNIDRSYAPDPFIAFATSVSTIYQDNMEGCLQEIFYEVSINHSSGCVSSSNIDGGPFSNDEAPESPVIDSVSVQLNGNEVYLGWQPSPSEDTDAYIVYSLSNGVFTAIDTVYGINTTFYTFSGLNPESASLSFAVSALDICLEEGLPAEEHSTILLDYELNSCDGSVDLNWNEYINWSGVSVYEVLQQLNNGVFSVVQTVPGNSVNTNVAELLPGAQYCFAIRAVSSSGQATSTSNTVCFVADVQDLPDFAYLRKATVLQNGAAYSACIIDTASDIASYRVLRSLYPGNLFDTLYTGFIPPQVDEVFYTDYGVNTLSQSYTYIYELIDKCGNASAISNPGRTILLRGEALDGFVNRLRWNSYAEWDAGVGKYRLFRSLDGGNTFNMISDMPSDTSFIDVVADQVDTLMTFCYYVEAVENQINSYGVRDTSRSNRVCVIQKPTVWIPSAFRPGNLAGNNTFKAVGLYEKLAINHVFSIFNRWGEQLFITSDPSEAWDGRYLSAIVPTGIYVYHLKFSLPDGTLFNERGSVMVLD